MTIFLTLNLTKNDNCKRYDEYEYDWKRLLCTVNIYLPIFHTSVYLKFTVKFNVKKVRFTVLYHFRSSLFGHVNNPQKDDWTPLFFWMLKYLFELNYLLVHSSLFRFQEKNDICIQKSGQSVSIVLFLKCALSWI